MSAWSPNLEGVNININEGRQNSVSKMFQRIRSGSLPGWIGRGTSTSDQICSIDLTSGHHSPQPPKLKSSLRPFFLRMKDIEMTAISPEKSLCLQVPVTPPSEEKASSSGSRSTGTWTNSIDSTTTAICTDDVLTLTSASVSPDESGDFHNPLLQTAKLSSLEDEYPSPLLTEPSLRTARKQFTIVPTRNCAQDDNGLNHLDLLDPVKVSKRRGNQNLGLILSALYGKLLVVMGIAFPMAEVISTYIPPSFYDGFYLYLYFGSITFMICVYGNMLRQKATWSVRDTLQRLSTMKSRLRTQHSVPQQVSTNPPEVSSDSEECTSGSVTGHHHHYDAHLDYSKHPIHFGSFYLRMGAVAFGIGSMIYSGLEFGQYFELDPDTKCHNFMIALTPAVRMIFTFMQMYFIFLNSKMAVYKLELGAQFGLMHMIGTNLCVWLNVLVQETRHEILMFYNPDNGTIIYPSSNNNHGASNSKFNAQGHNNPMAGHTRVRRGLKGPYSFLECRRSDIMGSLVQNASPFLFPCTIEYSLICAAILYVMWKSMAKMNNRRLHHFYNGDVNLYCGAKRSPHHYSVDCARANKGLFLGIFVLVMTIISLILFFVLITRPGYQALAVLEVNITELVLYTMTTVAVLVGMCQMRELRYVRSRNLELDNILLIVAQTGSFIYNVFTIIGGHFTMKTNTALVLVTALSSLIQLLVQTLFILDASKRSASTAEQARRKPGREVVTFLLVTNLAMWAINTLEKSRVDSHPVQLKFYGVWAWTIITHISMPLAIFYRFHSTVCLCEIWKRAYKIKPPVYQ